MDGTRLEGVMFPPKRACGTCLSPAAFYAVAVTVTAWASKGICLLFPWILGRDTQQRLASPIAPAVFLRAGLPLLFLYQRQ